MPANITQDGTEVKARNELHAKFQNWLVAIGGTEGTGPGEYALIEQPTGQCGVVQDQGGTLRQVVFADGPNLLTTWFHGGIRTIKELHMPQAEDALKLAEGKPGTGPAGASEHLF